MHIKAHWRLRQHHYPLKNFVAWLLEGNRISDPAYPSAVVWAFNKGWRLEQYDLHR